MRTTLEIDDDVFQAITKVAAERNTTIGCVLTDLARQAIAVGEGERVRNGVPLMPKGGSLPLTMELVNHLRDDD